MRTLLWEYVPTLRLMVCAQGDAVLDDAEWTAYAKELVGLYAGGHVRRVLVIAGGADGPNARQRKMLHHKGIYDDHPVETAVITSSVLTRGVVTAMSWFTDIRAFAPGELRAAFEYLSIPESEWEPTLRLVARLRIRLASPSTMAAQFDMSATIGKLDELVSERMPKLRERVERARQAAAAKPASPRDGGR